MIVQKVKCYGITWSVTVVAVQEFYNIVLLMKSSTRVYFNTKYVQGQTCYIQ